MTLLGGTGGAAGTSASSAPARTLVSVAKRTTIYKQGFEAVDATGLTSRHRFSVASTLVGASDLVVRFGNWGWGGAMTPSSALLIDASLEHPLTGRLFRLFFGGSPTAQLSPLAFVDSDPLALDVLGSASVYVRTWVRAPAGTVGTVDLPCDWTTDGGTGTWSQSGDHVMDTAPTPVSPGANPGPYQPQRYVYTPVGLFAQHVDPPAADVVALVGDSIMARHDESNYAQQAAATVPSIHLAAAGASITAWSQPGQNGTTATATSSPQMLLGAIAAAGATVVIVALGTNDAGSAQSAATVAGLLDSWCGQAKQRLYGRKKVIVCTIPPRTTGATNDQTPPASQVPDSTAAAFIVPYNTLLRAGLSNADWLLDAATAIECDAAGALTDNGGRTVLGASQDGTHPTTAGHNLIAPYAQDALTRVLAGQTGGVSRANPPSPTPPFNTVAPVASGSPRVGATLSCTRGTWSGYLPPTYTYQWKRAGSAISGATASTYLTVTADGNQAITCTVTATNASGTVPATSNAITPLVVQTPDQILGSALQARYRAGLVSGSDGAAIATWADATSGAHDLAQATGSHQPTIARALSSLGGKDAIRFNGQQPYGTTTQLMATTLTLVQPFELWVVLKATHPASDGGVTRLNNRYFLAGHAGSTTALSQNLSGQLFVNAGTNLGSPVQDVTTSARLIRGSFNGSSSLIALDSAGTVVATGNAGTNGATQLTVGADAFGNGAADADYAEILVVNRAVTSSEATALGNYFADQYGVA